MRRDGNGTLHMYIWVSHAIQRPASNNLPVLAVALEAVTKNKGIKLITRGGKNRGNNCNTNRLKIN